MDSYPNGSINGSFDDYENQIQKKLAAPIPWISFYIVAASLICSMAMVTDILNGIRCKRNWFQCEFFTLNATYLTVLAVSSKLAVDLSSSMLGTNDKLAKVSSLVFMSTAMCNFMPSIASMNPNEILSNLTALAILVVTIVVNVIIYDVQTRHLVDGQVLLFEEIVATVSMLLMLVILCCSSLVVPTTKKYIHSKYLEMNQIAQMEEGTNGIPKCGVRTVDEFRLMIQKYGVLAETGNPQFVMARSAISSISGLICLLMVFTLLEAHLRLLLSFNNRFGRSRSDYDWSTRYILYVQSTGVVLGSFAPVSRWLVATQLIRISDMSLKSLRRKLRIEKYWTLSLEELREGAISLHIGLHEDSKLFHYAKRLMIKIRIQVQILVVITSKSILLISSLCGSAILFCLRYISVSQRPEDPQVTIGSDFSRYVLLLEGEASLPIKIPENICSRIDYLIGMGRRRQNKNLVKLLGMSKNFDGVVKFDNNKEVGSLLHYTQEPPNCWSLPVVTLASIAFALPKVARHKFNELMSAMTEGIYLVKLIEKSLDGELDSIAKAAYGVWERAELAHNKRQQVIDIQQRNQNGYKHVLQDLSHIAKKIVQDFNIGIEDDVLMKNPLNWPFKVIAANSMYRITQTILLAHKQDDDKETDIDDEGEMFLRLSVMISDIFAACLTNLVPYINSQCQCSSINDKVIGVHYAAIILGQSEEILEILQRRELPEFCLGLAKATKIEEWRKEIRNLDNENPVSESSSNSDEYVHIDVDG